LHVSFRLACSGSLLVTVMVFVKGPSYRAEGSRSASFSV